jgi:hypothetical protein
VTGIATEIGAVQSDCLLFVSLHAPYYKSQGIYILNNIYNFIRHPLAIGREHMSYMLYAICRYSMGMGIKPYILLAHLVALKSSKLLRHSAYDICDRH